MVGAMVSHYRVHEILGVGGMGVVYRGVDTRLGRPVALKFLSPKLTADHHAIQRFQREARAVSALNHPNICTLYDIGEHEAQQFLVMELLEGQTLNHLTRGQPLPTNQILQLGLQIADALEAAHAQGIIHRDLKPSNIFVTRHKQAKVLDFGVAKVLSDTVAIDSAQPTATDLNPPSDGGVAVGTVAYMSPEQARGQEVDCRSDIFSLGLVLYEMATGCVAFTGPTPAVIFDAVLNRTPTPPLRLNPRLPPKLEDLLNKALEKDRDMRYQSMSELKADLLRLERDHGALARVAVTQPPAHTTRPVRQARPWALATIVVLLIVAGALITNRFGPWREENTARISIAVADFVNETGDPDLNGLSGMLITALQQSKRMSVLTRSRMLDTLRQTGRGNVERIDESLGREVCRQAQSDALVVASIRRFGRLYTIDLKVLDPDRNEYVFTAREETEGKERIPSLIDKLSERTRVTFRERLPEIQAASQKVAATTTTNLEAYQHFFQGEQLINNFDFESAQKEFQKAVTVDPTFGLAYYRLAYAATWLATDPYEPAAAAKAPIQKAIELIDRIPERERYLARAVHALVHHAIGQKGLEVALPILTEMELRFPDDKEALFMLGDIHLHAGRYVEALHYLERTLKLDPSFSLALDHVIWAYGGLKRFDKMLEAATHFASVAPSYRAYLRLSIAAQVSGQEDAAIRVFKTMEEAHPEQRELIRMATAWQTIESGEFAEAERALSDGLAAVAAIPRIFQVSMLIEAGEAFRDAGAYRRAEVTFRKALALDPENEARTASYLGWSLFDQHRFAEAKEIFQKSFVRHSRDSFTLSGLWNITLRQRDDAEALRYAKEALSWRSSWASFLRLSSTHLYARRSKEADETVEKGFTELPDTGAKRTLLARASGVNLMVGRFERAEELARRARELDPKGEDVQVMLVLADALLAQNKLAEAETMYQKVKDSGPIDKTSLADVWRQTSRVATRGLVRLSIRRGDYTASEHHLARFVKRRPSRASEHWAELMRTQVAMVRKNYAVAERHARRALRLNPDESPQTLIMLAYAAALQKHYQEARLHAENAMAMAPSFQSKNVLAWILVVGDIDVDRGLELAGQETGWTFWPEFGEQPYSFYAWPEETLGLAYLKRGEYTRAAEYLEQTLKVHPDRESSLKYLQEARKGRSDASGKLDLFAGVDSRLLSLP